MRYAAALVVLTALTGCPEVDCPGAEAADATLVLGTGFETFEPLTADTVLEPAWGGQGGTHFWIALRTTGLLDGYTEPGPPGQGERGRDQPYVTVALNRPDGVEVAEFSSSTSMTDGDALGITAFMMGEFSGDWFNSDDAEVVAMLQETEDMDLDLAVTVEDACGTSLAADTTVRVVFPWLD